MRKNNKIFIIVTLLLISVVSSWVFAETDSRSIDKIYTEDFQDPLFSLLYYINNYYYGKDSVDYQKVLDGALTGIMNGLDDPFAWYFDARQTKENEIDETGKYGGLGITITYDQKAEAIKIVSPMTDTPAEAAGLLPDDYIISVEGSPVSELGYYKAVDVMRGEPNTPVKIEVFRTGWESSKEIIVYRALIETKTVKYDFLNIGNNRIAYIKITNFGETTADEMKSALNEISAQNPSGVVLDLRNNPGGLLNIVVDVASMFIKNGVIVNVKYYNGYQENMSSEPGKYFNIFDKTPMVLLVNKGSASASEILTGALKDDLDIPVIGQTTYGKAAVQRPFQLSNGGEVWLPIGRYLTPSGKDIHLKGFDPDIFIEQTEKEVVSQDTEEALNATTNKVSIDTENDNQLKKGLEILIEKIGATR
ncbi:MAG: S41 family peptidase [Thermotogae bacterium]|nr:S41 family peptidase [Thermotogota bacterium]